MSQTSVSMNMAVARAGMAAYPLRDSKIDSYAAEGAVKFGYAVVAGTAGEQVKHAAVVGNKFRGIAMMTQAIESGTATDAQYPDKDAVNVMSFGEIWAPYSGTAPAVDAVLYVDVLVTPGKLTAVSTNNLAAPLKARKVDTTLGLVLAVFTEAV